MTTGPEAASRAVTSRRGFVRRSGVTVLVVGVLFGATGCFDDFVWPPTDMPPPATEAP